MAAIEDNLLERISARAHDPLRRTDMSGAQAASQPLDLGSLLGDLQKHGAPGAQPLLGAFGRLSSLFGGLESVASNFAVVTPGTKADPSNVTPLAPPPSVGRLDAAEVAIGRPLPPEVRQLYAVADGGYGPGDGLMPLDRLVSTYRERTAEPFGPMDQPWPPHLLPLFEEDQVTLAIDLDAGAIVAWDPERLEDLESDEDWQASFVQEHPGLSALMTDWLDRPTFMDSRGAG